MSRIPALRTVVATVLVLCLSACDNTSAAEYLARAEGSFAAAEYRTAVIELKNALQQQPDLAAARALLGQTYFKLGDYSASVRELERAQDLGVPTAELALELLSAKNRIGRFQEVIGALADTPDLTPQMTAVLADAYFAGQDLAMARTLYEQSLGTPAGNLGLGRLAWANGDPERARSYLNRAVELAGDNVEILLSLAEFELSQGDTALARSAFQRSVSLAGGSVSGELGLARVAMAEADLELAREHIDRVLAAAPQLYLAHYLDALIRFQNQDLEGAEAGLREVQRVAADHPPSLFLMGAVKYQQGQLFQAQDNLQRYLAIDSDNESAAKLLASIYLQQDDLEDLVSVLGPYTDVTADPQLLAMLGSAQLRLGNAAEATRFLQAAVELAPDAAAFKNQLALSFLSAGESEQAEAVLQSAIEVDGDQFQSDYLLAMIRLRDGDFEGSMPPIDALIEKNPDSPLGYNLKGGALLGLDDQAAARKQFAQALELDPTYLPAASNLARLDLQQQDLVSARSRYEGILEADSGNEAARLALVRLALQQGERVEATSILEQILQENAESVQAHLLLARIQLGESRLAEAQAHIDAALKSNPDNPELRLLAAQIDLGRGDVAAARDHTQVLQRLLAQNNRTEVLTTLGALQLRTGEFTLARRNLELALSQAPESIDTLVQLARLNLRESELAQARQNLETLMSLDAASQEINLLSAQVLEAEGQLDNAAAAYQTLADSGVRDAVIRLIALSIGQNDSSSALAASEQWLSNHPDDSGVRLLRADVLLRTANNTQAISEYEVLARADNPVALNNLAWLYLQENDSRALATAQRAYELAPENADIADTLGWTLVQLGRADEGRGYLEQSLERNAENPSVRFHLAQATADLGDTEAALELLASLDDGPVFPEQPDAVELQRQLLAR